ncbi:MAG: 30S ribosomal protein S20 [bacterium]|nr:30S ribosomal protein S20 [bacterium]
MAETKKRNTKKKINSAVKRARQAIKRRTARMAVKSKLRGTVKKATAVKTGEQLPNAYSQIDKAAKKGVLHKNTAARMKSRLAKAVKKV